MDTEVTLLLLGMKSEINNSYLYVPEYRSLSVPPGLVVRKGFAGHRALFLDVKTGIEMPNQSSSPASEGQSPLPPIDTSPCTEMRNALLFGPPISGPSSGRHLPPHQLPPALSQMREFVFLSSQAYQLNRSGWT